MSKGSVFRNSDGWFQYYGRQNDAETQRYISDGGTFVEGVYGGGPAFQKLEGGSVVPDTDRQQAVAAKKQGKLDDLTGGRAAALRLKNTITDPATDYTLQATQEALWQDLAVVLRVLIRQ